MKCIIVGLKSHDYTNKKDQHIKGFEVNMLADNPDVFGKVFKDCFISVETPIYHRNAVLFDDLDALIGRVVNAEWDVVQYGEKAVKRLISFDFLDEYVDLVPRGAKKV